MRESIAMVSGFLGMITSIFIFIGFWRQILENRRKGKVEGLALSLIIFGCCSCTFWSVHGWAKASVYLGIAQTLGLVSALTVLVQWFKYNKPKAPSESES